MLAVEGSELTYRVTGDGPPVVLMHGGFGVIEVWDEIAAALAETHRVVDEFGAVDAPPPGVGGVTPVAAIASRIRCQSRPAPASTTAAVLPSMIK